MDFDETFKILLVGDSGVGKSSILLRFTDDVFEPMQPTIGVDFKVKAFNVDNRRVKMTIWDTAGQERFRTLTSAYYRGAHGVILVYDVSKRETFEALKQVWLKEVAMYSTKPAAVKMVVGNKVDIEQRQVSREEGLEFARQQSTLFVESSAKTATGVQQTFEELLRKILETPQLCASDSSTAANIRPSADNASSPYAESCSC
ncbi:unnamed protein product [Agarophyton chilense]